MHSSRSQNALSCARYRSNAAASRMRTASRAASSRTSRADARSARREALDPLGTSKSACSSEICGCQRRFFSGQGPPWLAAEAQAAAARRTARGGRRGAGRERWTATARPSWRAEQGSDVASSRVTRGGNDDARSRLRVDLRSATNLSVLSARTSIASATPAPRRIRAPPSHSRVSLTAVALAA